MKKSDFYYDLPTELIAQTPLERRDASRLLTLDKRTGATEHHVFHELPDFLNEGDCLVMNDSRVIPARLFGTRPTGGSVEVVLLRDLGGGDWECLTRPGRKTQPGTHISFGNGELTAEVIRAEADGNKVLHFNYDGIFLELLDKLGKMPLPPYIKEELTDKERYQTVYSRDPGSAAAPTAGLHFTPELLEKIQAKGVKLAYITLHVGLGTFRPVKAEEVTEHHMHSEFCMISQETADKVRKAMEELDYHPNLRAKNFAKQSARTIIFVAELGKGTGFANPQMFEILCGLEEVLAQKDYTLVVRNIAAGDCAEFIRNAADTKQADGFVIHASVISQALDELLFTHEIPHIVIGNPNFNSHFCWLDIDNRLAGELAAKHLLERGCQSVAFIGGKPEDQISARRLDGVLTVLKEHDVLLPREYVKKGESVCDSGYRMTMQILENRRRPDALVCADNYIAYGCVNALHDRGILIPEEMKVITFDDFPFSQILKPMLSVVNIDVYDMGVQAGKYILQKIKRPNLYVQSHITFPTLIIREST